MRRLRAAALLLLAGALAIALPRAADGQPGAVEVVDPEGSVDAQIASALADVEEEQARKSRVEAEIGGLGDRRADASRRLRGRARALYRVTRAGMLPVAGGFDALLAHLGRVERLERMVKHDVAALESLRTRGDALRAELARATAAIERAEGRVRALRARKEQLARARQNAVQLETALRSGSAGVAPPSDLQYGTIRVVGDGAEEDFASLRGQLIIPVAVAAAVRDGRREDGQGLELLAPPHTAVRAVASGRIAFAERYGAYGRLVIVDHGDDYYTLYGGLGRVDAAVGDWIGRGGRIGDVGTDSMPAALFFEVRRGTRALPARDWLGL